VPHPNVAPIATPTSHFEEIQLYVDHISKDRIRDIACNLLKSFLIDYTIQQCETHHIPTSKASASVYNYRENKLVPERDLALPTNPETKKPIVLGDALYPLISLQWFPTPSTLRFVEVCTKRKRPRLRLESWDARSNSPPPELLTRDTSH
jgi:hypothetical protein